LSDCIRAQAHTVDYFQIFQRLASSESLKLHLLGDNVHTLAWTIANELARHQSQTQMPSTGMLALLAALVACEQVDVYGFGDVPHIGRYWQTRDQHTAGDDAPAKVYEFAIEEYLVRVLDAEDFAILPATFDTTLRRAASVTFRHNALLAPVCFDRYIAEAAARLDATRSRIYDVSSRVRLCHVC
jgi:hypothetical protein